MLPAYAALAESWVIGDAGEVLANLLFRVQCLSASGRWSHEINVRFTLLLISWGRNPGVTTSGQQNYRFGKTAYSVSRGISARALYSCHVIFTCSNVQSHDLYITITKFRIAACSPPLNIPCRTRADMTAGRRR